MGKPVIRPGAKRYSIALDEQNYEAFKQIFRDCGASPSTPGVVINEYVKLCVEIVNQAKGKGRDNDLTLGEVLFLMGAQTRRMRDGQAELL